MIKTNKLIIKFGRLLPDKLYLKILYKNSIGKRLNLKNPQTYNEKIQWLKLHDYQPIYSVMVDKYAVRKYISETIGDEYLIPLVGGPWKSFDEIDISSLPDQFVLKCTHDSGGLVICKDKSSFDLKKAKEKIEKCLKKNYYYNGREKPYKTVSPQIIAEKYMTDESGYELKDYKFYCFDGVARLMMLASDRFTGKQKHFDYFDREKKPQQICWGVPNSPIPPVVPETFDEMLVLAEKLSAGIPHLRVDFYQISGKIYFGELTFYDGSGFDPIEPPEWDLRLGEWIRLPQK